MNGDASWISSPTFSLAHKIPSRINISKMTKELIFDDFSILRLLSCQDQDHSTELLNRSTSFTKTLVEFQDLINNLQETLEKHGVYVDSVKRHAIGARLRTRISSQLLLKEKIEEGERELKRLVDEGEALERRRDEQRRLMADLRGIQ